MSLPAHILLESHSESFDAQSFVSREKSLPASGGVIYETFIRHALCGRIWEDTLICTSDAFGCFSNKWLSSTISPDLK
jgi:hypothetical protein